MGVRNLAIVALKVLTVLGDLGVRAAFHFDGGLAARVFFIFANGPGIDIELDFAFAQSIAGASIYSLFIWPDSFGLCRGAAFHVAAIVNIDLDGPIGVVLDREARAGFGAHCKE